jgi:NADPH2:quinone reductase
MVRAIRVHSPGSADSLIEEEVGVPGPQRGEARVKVEYAGVNFIDVYKRSGAYSMPLPATPGEEAAGVVDAVGEGVKIVRPGDRVAWAGSIGAYAEQAVVSADILVPIPDGVDTKLAAAVMLQGMTAHYLTSSTFPLKDGDRCLVHAAAGGVGLLLVQLAKRRGAYVIGTAGSDEKAQLARDAGADEVIVYTRHDFVKEVQRINGSSGLHVVYDSVGKTTFLGNLDLLAPRGMMVLFGQSSGPVDPIDPQLLNQKGSLFLTRPTLRHYSATREELLWRSGELFDLIQKGELDVRVAAEFPLSAAADAHRALEGRTTAGKVLLRV